MPHTLKILAVDDQPDMRMLLGLCLGQVETWDVSLADSLASALAQVRTFGPDVILLDNLLPDGRGTDLLAQLRNEEHPICDTPVIFLTGDRDVRALKAAGALGVIAKPFRFEDLHLQIQAILTHAGLS